MREMEPPHYVQPLAVTRHSSFFAIHTTFFFLLYRGIMHPLQNTPIVAAYGVLPLRVNDAVNRKEYIGNLPITI